MILLIKNKYFAVSYKDGKLDTEKTSFKFPVTKYNLNWFVNTIYDLGYQVFNPLFGVYQTKRHAKRYLRGLL